ncbi:hypothetical protein AB0C10_16060 [Microbispora amethystogenes]|uniref:hypothetical protein n=1 Tax=Microbispora amethystogenes TaxID=1427754 RepID=UPI0033D094A2
MSPAPDPTLADLIHRRRTERGLEGPLKIAQCAQMLRRYTSKPFTDRTWSNYEQAKTWIPDRELVLMALVVGATPDELAAAGRAEAASMLRNELTHHAGTSAHADFPDETVALMQRVDRDIDEMPNLSPDQKDRMKKVFRDKLNAVAELTREQLKIMRS